MSSYESSVKSRMAAKFPPELLGGKFRGKAPKGQSGYPHIFKTLDDNFIDGSHPIMKRLKGSLPDGKIAYNCAEHLNSSQTMCISFFKKFFESKHYESLLAEILMILNIDIAGTEFTDAMFEYEPNPNEGTNFDFYLKLSDGRNISWEVKFTENEFGGITTTATNTDKYITKWEEIYTPLLRNCAYYDFPDVSCDDYTCLSSGKLTNNCPVCETCSIHEFYKYYQIRRNISYATAPGDYVLFLTPKENLSLNEGRTYIEKYANQWAPEHIRNIFWEDLLAVTLRVVSCNTELLDYYSKFKEKYFD